VSELVRLYIWNLGDSKTTLDELREHLPVAVEPDVWLSNEAGEEFDLLRFA
jgi:hypothetical protein